MSQADWRFCGRTGLFFDGSREDSRANVHHRKPGPVQHLLTASASADGVTRAC